MSADHRIHGRRRTFVITKDMLGLIRRYPFSEPTPILIDRIVYPYSTPPTVTLDCVVTTTDCVVFTYTDKLKGETIDMSVHDFMKRYQKHAYETLMRLYRRAETFTPYIIYYPVPGG